MKMKIKRTTKAKRLKAPKSKQATSLSSEPLPSYIITAKQAIRALQRIVKAKGDLPLLTRDRGGMNRFVRSVELAVWDARIWCIVVDADH